MSCVGKTRLIALLAAILGMVARLGSCAADDPAVSRGVQNLRTTLDKRGRARRRWPSWR